MSQNETGQGQLFGFYGPALYNQGYLPIPAATYAKAPSLPADGTPGFLFKYSEANEDNVKDLLQNHLKRFAGDQIGLSTNNLTVIDVDIVDPHLASPILKSIYQRVPTPLIRIGKKGACFFYKRTKPLPSYKMAIGEVLADRKFVMIPPSIHPETNRAYFWANNSEDILNVDWVDLPELSDSDLKFINEIKNPEINPKTKIQRQRNDQLKAVATVLIHKNIPEEKAINQLIESDLARHSTGFAEGPLFVQLAAKNRTTKEHEAKRFYESIRKSIGEPTQPTSRLEAVSDEDFLSFVRQEENFGRRRPTLPLPPNHGLIRSLVHLANYVGNKEQNNMGIGAALALGSLLICSRYSAKMNQHVVSPNLYNVCVGVSGGGKGVTYGIVKDLILRLINTKHPDITHHSIGSFYRSDAGIYAGFSVQKNRLDIIDEFDRMLATGAGKESFQSNITTTLNELYSCARSVFSPGMKKDYAGETFFGPHLSVLGYIQPKLLERYFKGTFVSSGFFPRLSFFFQESLSELQDNEFDEARYKNLFDEVFKFVSFVSKEKLRIHPSSFEIWQEYKTLTTKHEPLKPDEKERKKEIYRKLQFDPIEIRFSEDAVWFYEKKLKEIRKNSLSNFEENKFSVESRGPEKALKFALIHHCTKDSYGLSPEASAISVETLSWAFDLVESLDQTFEPIRKNAEEHDPEIGRVISAVKRATLRLSGKEMLLSKFINDQKYKLTLKQRTELTTTITQSGIARIQYKNGAVWIAF